MIRNKGDVRILTAFKNVLVHSPVSCFAPAIAAFGVNNDLSGAFARLDHIANGPALQFKRAVDGMKNITQRELDAGLGRAQF